MDTTSLVTSIQTLDITVNRRIMLKLSDKIKKLESLIKTLDRKERELRKLKKEVLSSNRRTRSKAAMKRIRKLIK